MTRFMRSATRWRMLLACAVLSGAVVPELRAQVAVRGVPRATSVAGASVGFLSQLIVASPTVIPRSRAKCSPGECFSQFVSTKANAKWQLQVRLRIPTVGYTLDLSNTSTPSLARARLSSTVWTPVYITGPATANLTNEATYYAAKTNGKAGVVPTNTDIGLLLEYRVVALP